MAVPIDLTPYQSLPKNQVLKVTYSGNIIYVKNVLLGQMMADAPTEERTNYKGLFTKILDFDLYKQDRYNSLNLAFVTIDTASTDVTIEVMEI